MKSVFIAAQEPIRAIVPHTGSVMNILATPIVTNAALAAYATQHELHDFGPLQLRAVYGVYLLRSQTVWTPQRQASPSRCGILAASSPSMR